MKDKRQIRVSSALTFTSAVNGVSGQSHTLADLSLGIPDSNAGDD
jgi:hypothetical protein